MKNYFLRRLYSINQPLCYQKKFLDGSSFGFFLSRKEQKKQYKKHKKHKTAAFPEGKAAIFIKN
jgi:hypothetical protein